jgi:hypothetical protein
VDAGELRQLRLQPSTAREGSAAGRWAMPLYELFPYLGFSWTKLPIELVNDVMEHENDLKIITCILRVVRTTSEDSA